jgi:hypothetical protein
MQVKIQETRPFSIGNNPIQISDKNAGIVTEAFIVYFQKLALFLNSHFSISTQFFE